MWCCNSVFMYSQLVHFSVSYHYLCMCKMSLLEFVDLHQVHPCTAEELLLMSPHYQLLTTACLWTEEENPH